VSGEDRGFKIVDRRRFTIDGDERAAPSEPATKPQASSAEAPEVRVEPKQDPPEKPKVEEKQAEPEEVETEGGLTFAIFIQSLAQQAMMQLGLVPWPHTGQRGLQLEQARDTIDVLELLAAKTKGNLTTDEKTMLDTVLYELRMTYVEINNQLAAAATKGPGPVGPA
jgi:hypothetical protein